MLNNQKQYLLEPHSIVVLKRLNLCEQSFQYNLRDLSTVSPGRKHLQAFEDMEKQNDLLQSAIIFTIILVITYCFLNLISLLTFWRRRNIQYLRPSLSTTDFTWMYFNDSRFSFYKRLYEKANPFKYCGYYNFYQPTLLIRSPELVKNVLVSQFNNFSHRRTIAPVRKDAFFHFLFNINDHYWKVTRKAVDSGFSSARQKNRMFEAMVTTGMKNRDFLVKMVNQNNTEDINSFSGRYLVDIMFACLYEANANCVEDSSSIFWNMAKRVISRTDTALKLNIAEWILEPNYLGRFLGMSISEKLTSDFYAEQIVASMKWRQENDITEVDLVQHFMNLNKMKSLNGPDMPLDNLLLAVLYTVVPTMLSVHVINTSLCCSLFEIAKNPDIQSRLQQEIDEQLQLTNGVITYNALCAMNYLKNIVLETYRKYPTTPEITRTCSETCVLQGTNLTVRKGDYIIISVSGMHHDPEFYPEPEKFDPERFSENGKKSRHPFCYVPFAGGPRSCISERLVKLALRIAIVSLLSKYDVSTLSTCTDTVEFEKRKFFSIAKGIKLRFTERKLEV